MDQCTSAVLSLAPSIVLFNFATVTLAVIVARYIDRVLWSPNTISDDTSSNSDSSSDDEVSSSEENSDNEKNSNSTESSGSDKNSDDTSNPAESVAETPAFITDADLIASVRELSVLTVPEVPTPEVQTADHLPKKMMEVVQKVSQVLSQDVNMAPEKKQAFANVLKDIPDLITKMSGPNCEDVEAILNQKATGVQAILKGISEQHESDMLMQTLDALKS